MDLARLAAIVLIVGFVTFWIGNLYSPPRVYQETDLELRLQIVAAYPSRFALSQALGGVGLGMALIGLLLLSVHFASDAGPWLTSFPAAANMLAIALSGVWLVRYIGDPAAVWGRLDQSPLMVVATSLMMIAAIMYGFLFLQVGLPAWLGYLHIGYGFLALAAIVFVRPPAFVVISLYFFALVATAAVLYLRT